MKYKNNIKMTWSVVKEAIGKNSSRRQNFPNKIDSGSKFIASTDSIDESLINISLKLAQMLQKKK